MFDRQDAQQLIGADLYAESDQKVGRIGQIYLDDQTGRPEWATVNTGFLGGNESFVPLQRAQRTESGLAVPYSKDRIKDAPNVDPGEGHIAEDQEETLYQHYGLSYSRSESDSGLPGDDAPEAMSQSSGTTTGEESMVRSEEQMHVGKERVETGRARLRKYAVTEEESVSVPVRKEKARLETEPLTDEDRARGTEIAEGESEVTLTEERPVVHKETVAKEKVGLATEVEEEQRTVAEEVRKERVDVEGDVEGTPER
jgi:uncharacterized protein (TIGR02271 family)